ncbi:hypothetical protein PCC7418_3000 [Halothece sp. PCC 7418]|uniref:hypothetical protein n=1 Tax=Halothece sp. (strain PCC 7418) TaxID=65093 RepID=UPI0002A05F6F|nr:hypothetical protein [Halothece sp. PCC 7418]AFZ45125.1 hypothetical protein PCC7418_3000 [Halothece sp. PCC 7418]
MNKDSVKWDLDSPWCIGSEDYNTLTKYVDGKSPRLIVELGSGLSTFQLANDFPEATLISLENDPRIREQNLQTLEFNQKNSANILLAPIKLQFYKGASFITYDFNKIKNTSQIDLLIVDGPVERLFPMGRESSLYFLFNQLAIGAIIGLDDYHRTSAKSTVSNWLSVFGNSLLLQEETDSFAVLRKKSECVKPKLGISLALKSYKALTQSLLVNTRRTISFKLRPEKNVEQ